MPIMLLLPFENRMKKLEVLEKNKYSTGYAEILQVGAKFQTVMLLCQIPVIIGGYELRIFCIRSSYITHHYRLGNYFICKGFPVQTLLW